MIHDSFWMECDDCGDLLLDEKLGQVLYAPTQRNIHMAAYSRGWSVSPVHVGQHLCPDCRKEAGL